MRSPAGEQTARQRVRNESGAVGGGQIMKDLLSHTKKLELYAEPHGEPLKRSKQGSNIVRFIVQNVTLSVKNRLGMGVGEVGQN